ncbi:unnamed protein product [Mytilus coruscus]|uniref:Uncharacterized protein n=1 Tax=Mytilus coruscus TaxID=42192 RepID=A0A6J8AEF7_MYTCO|nr:unnamed protein product [Mytilus coruscus]
MKGDTHKEQSRQELLKNVFKYARVPHNPRIISWIIYYGHTDILTTIVNLVKEHNDSNDIVFGSDITEQTRLLTLGCYSGKDDMVNLILKYVKIGCINRTSLDKTLNCDEPENEIYFNMHRINTPLTAACDSGNLSVEHILLRNKANINQCDDFDRFPLLTASQQGHIEVVEYLLQKGGNVNQCNENNVTCLFGASCKGHYNVVKYLVEQGAHVNHCEPYKMTEKDLEEAIEKMFEGNGADVNQCNEYDVSSPLYKAEMEGKIDFVENMVANGADVLECCKYNRSPFNVVCRTGHSDIAYILLDNRTNITQCEILQKSQLYEACKGGHNAVVEISRREGSRY